jgi:hypothetical protein
MSLDAYLLSQSQKGFLPLHTTDLGAPLERTVVFDGDTADDQGDFDGAGNPMALFTVTGTVLVKLFARCNTSLTGASATIRVGTALSDAGLIASTTATNIAANEIWHDASPDASIELSTILTEKIVNQDILQTVGTANISTGSLTYFLLWRPISSDGKVEVAS